MLGMPRDLRKQAETPRHGWIEAVALVRFLAVWSSGEQKLLPSTW